MLALTATAPTTTIDSIAQGLHMPENAKVIKVSPEKCNIRLAKCVISINLSLDVFVDR